MVYDLHFGCKGTIKKRDTQEKKKKNHRSPAWDVTIRNADAKKSKHSFSYQRPQNCEKTQKKCKNIWSCQKKVVILHDFFAD